MINTKYLLRIALVLELILLSISSRADEPSTSNEAGRMQSDVESTVDGRWVINNPDSRKIYAVQCGLDVTLFAFKYFKVDYSLPRISHGLPLSEEGISLASVQQMIVAHGLEAEARKNVTLKQIAYHLKGEYIAILPMSLGNGFNHYYVGLMDDNGEVQLVNVSNKKLTLPLATQVKKEIPDIQTMWIRLQRYTTSQKHGKFYDQMQNTRWMMCGITNAMV